MFSTRRSFLFKVSLIKDAIEYQISSSSFEFWIFLYFSLSYHIYVNILHNTVKAESSRCVLRASLFILNRHNLEQGISKQFLSFILSFLPYLFSPIFWELHESKIFSFSSQKMNERLENLTCVPPWTLSALGENWIKFFLFLCRSLVISDNIRNGIKMLPLHTLPYEQKKSFAFFSPKKKLREGNHVYSKKYIRQAYNETDSKTKSFLC